MNIKMRETFFSEGRPHTISDMSPQLQRHLHVSSFDKSCVRDICVIFGSDRVKFAQITRTHYITTQRFVERPRLSPFITARIWSAFKGGLSFKHKNDFYCFFPLSLSFATNTLDFSFEKRTSKYFFSPGESFWKFANSDDISFYILLDVRIVR